MSTGDMKNNLKKLQKEANMMHYPEDLDYDGLAKGEPEAHLAILYHAFFEYSNNSIHQYLTKLGYNISGRRGNSFLAVVFKIIRDHNSTLKVTLRVAQFMSKGFTERKIMLTTAILNYVRTNLRNCCSAKPSNHSKRLANFQSENKPKVCDRTSPDMSCIQHNHKVTRTFHHDEMPIKILHSTAVKSIGQRINCGPTQAIQTSHEPVAAVGRDVDCTMANKTNCLISNEKIEHGAMLESVRLVQGAENVRNAEAINQKISSTGSLPSEFEELLKRVESLELKNEKISHQLEEQKIIIEELKKDNEMLKQIVERDHHLVQEHASAVNQLKESQLSSKHPTSYIHTPICGKLCNQFSNFRLDSRKSDANGDVFLDNSLSDITNESPLNPTHSRSEKLFELVRDTRSLLGMDVNTPTACKYDLENDVGLLNQSADDSN